MAFARDHLGANKRPRPVNTGAAFFRSRSSVTSGAFARRLVLSADQVAACNAVDVAANQADVGQFTV
jgi:hypothetical protein